MSVWLFMFSWLSLSLCAMLDPQLTLKFIKCSKRKKKKALALQVTSEVFSVFFYSCLHHPHHFHNIYNSFINMVAKIKYNCSSVLLARVCFRHFLPPTPIPEKLDAQILYGEWQIKWIHIWLSLWLRRSDWTCSGNFDQL